MSETVNTALARRWFEEVWNTRREATIHELMHPEAIGHLEGLDARGVAEFLKARGVLLGAFPDLRLTVEATVAQGEDVAVRWTATGTHRGSDLDIPATGLPVAFRGITWIRFSNGRLIEGWDAWNQGSVLALLQAAAPSAAPGGAA